MAIPTMRQVLARAGEEAAACFLAERGYVILARNARLHNGELDIVARDGRTLVFVEVKTRASVRYGKPQEAVERRKQERVRNLALAWMQNHRLNDSACRFDVIAVRATNEGKVLNVEHFLSSF
ncbi:MAG: YraN family protein [Armatimonadetes bacterium]|nr:YraN family protein [Armatimonadota bacterium]